jgi:hypothetical protein
VALLLNSLNIYNSLNICNVLRNSLDIYNTLNICQRGLTGEMSKYVPFLHSESSHSLPTQPTETVLALNES